MLKQYSEEGGGISLAIKFLMYISSSRHLKCSVLVHYKYTITERHIKGSKYLERC